MSDHIKIEACAQAAHEVNRAYCAALGDFSQKPWEDAPAWQKSSAITGVAVALAGGTSADAHASWLAEKEANGWKWGQIKNEATKEHPCLVPYGALAPEQKHKDQLFISTVRCMAAALGMRVTYPAIPESHATESMPYMPGCPRKTTDYSFDPPRSWIDDGTTPVDVTG